ncbi:MAG: hypothetical protein ACLGG0_09675 [Bacteriovoracia bacterium]
MFIKIVVLCLMTTPVWAISLKVQSTRINYQVTWDEQSLYLTSHRMNFSMKRSSCNAHILDRFLKQYHNFNKLNHQRSDERDMMTYRLDGKQKTISTRSRLGKVLTTLPREVKRMKMEEALACKKS